MSSIKRTVNFALTLGMLVLFNLAALSYADKYNFQNMRNHHCQSWMDECHYVLKVHECYSMAHHNYIIYAQNREIFGYNDFVNVKLNDSDVLTLDGIYNQKVKYKLSLNIYLK
jgi:hypothetical protein